MTSADDFDVMYARGRLATAQDRADMLKTHIHHNATKLARNISFAWFDEAPQLVGALLRDVDELSRWQREIDEWFPKAYPEKTMKAAE